MTSLADPPAERGLQEHGFWDYTTPGAGGMEMFQAEDYLALLDDMAEAGMNSLAVNLKWLTTGYRSRLDFMDQLPGNPMIESDNDLMRMLIEEAHRRRIRIILNAAITCADAGRFGLTPLRTVREMFGYPLPFDVGLYDLDTPGVIERAAAVFDELVELFPETDGICVEAECSGEEAPHRIPKYEEWARAHGRKPFAQIGHPLDPRTIDVSEWRDYTTHRRIELLRAVSAGLDARGFRGDRMLLCEPGPPTSERWNLPACCEVNTRMLAQAMPGWPAVTYEYQKWNMRYAMMDMCVSAPRHDGLKVYYVPRGVMTWHPQWPMPISLQQSWEMDVADILLFRPEGVWWFGCDARNIGTHADLERLHQAGFRDGRDARRALLKTIRPLQAATSSAAINAVAEKRRQQ